MTYSKSFSRYCTKKAYKLINRVLIWHTARAWSEWSLSYLCSNS